MKIYNREDSIFEERLKLQSVRRYLEAKNLPCNTDYYKTDDFINKHYKNWSLIEKKNFLMKMFGIGLWIKVFKRLEKK